MKYILESNNISNKHWEISKKIFSSPQKNLEKKLCDMEISVRQFKEVLILWTWFIFNVFFKIYFSQIYLLL